MATYTDNYQLTKPTYAEQADIGVINSNMNIIDDIMHSSQVSLAPAYDQSQTYAEGDVVMYELLMYKCISPTTGVWDGSKWERTTASESGGGGSAELDILGEASGAVASFADGASAELAKCIAEINPTQDLHGYDKPWAGGAGKNKFNIDENRIGIDYDDSSSLSRFWQTVSLPNGNYTISFNGNMTGISEISFGKADSMLPFSSINQHVLRTVMSSSNTSLTVTIDASYPFVFIGVIKSSGSITKADIDNLQIQIETGNTATAYEPYSNICPINGHSSVTVTVSDGETSTTKTTPLGQTVYGGQLNVLTGELEVTWGNIASYAGETLPGEWLSSLDEYTALETPTTGAQVVYELATPQTVQLTPQEVNSLLGQNNISADTGDVDIVYVKASAPIQPNPTGTPTATLKKLGIEGAVFEIPSGGGGSSGGINYSTTEQRTGQKWIDGKDIYQITIINISVPSNGTVSINTPISIEHLVNWFGTAYNADLSNQRPLPFPGGSNSDIRIDYVSNQLRMVAFADWTGFSAYLTVQYTKITD